MNPNESKDKVVINSLNRLFYFKYGFVVMMACERKRRGGVLTVMCVEFKIDI